MLAGSGKRQSAVLPTIKSIRHRALSAAQTAARYA